LDRAQEQVDDAQGERDVGVVGQAVVRRKREKALEQGCGEGADGLRERRMRVVVRALGPGVQDRLVVERGSGLYPPRDGIGEGEVERLVPRDTHAERRYAEQDGDAGDDGGALEGRASAFADEKHGPV
jgi:hypothetical protein